MGERQRPFGTANQKMPGTARAFRCSHTVRWMSCSGRFMSLQFAYKPLILNPSKMARFTVNQLMQPTKEATLNQRVLGSSPSTPTSLRSRSERRLPRRSRERRLGKRARRHDRRPYSAKSRLERSAQAARSRPVFANAQPGFLRSARFPFRRRLTMYSLPSIGAMCGGSLSR